MFYRENGQYKTSYAADAAIFPIRQDKIAIGLLLLFAFAGVPLLAIMGVGPFGHDYIFKALLIPFLILALAAIGLNILVGYCGQISLGAGAFMAVGAYSAYNFALRIPEMPLRDFDPARRRRRGPGRDPVRNSKPTHQGALSRRRYAWPRSSFSTGYSCA